MNYKIIFRSQKFRLSFLKLFNFINDKTMIKIQYRIAMGYKLKLNSPIRFTEKLQWYKLYYRKDLMTLCADKYNVRKYVKSKGYEEILVPLLGVYKNAKEINFDLLPNKFVLKTTNGSHTNIFCENKEKLNKKDTRDVMNKWLKPNKSSPGREWAYYRIKPQIICEEFLEKDENDDLIDYKFFCFNGKVFCLYVITDRNKKSGIKLGIYNNKFEKMPYYRTDIKKQIETVQKPKNFDNMILIAEDLSRDFPHVRVDLYNIKGKIYFGELTFYDGSGYKGFDPEHFDIILGKKFILPNIK